MSAVEATTFEHQACICGSDRQFLEMALPFLETGLANGEPVLAVTTPANLELISAALGVRAGDVDYAESAFFGRRPPQRIAAFHRYSQRHAPGATAPRCASSPNRSGPGAPRGRLQRGSGWSQRSMSRWPRPASS